MSTMISLTNYLLNRLNELGADRVFGVPGDFTLSMLDHIGRDGRLRWVGCANELGAGYAADGYARVRGIGVLCTTFGVGELSAINAIAGSFAEYVPVVHVVGAPSRAVQAAHNCTHHSLGTGDFGVFERMSREVVCAHATLDEHNACAEIDRVLREVVSHRRPGYIVLPSDLSDLPVRAPGAPLSRAGNATDPVALHRFSRDARALLNEASSVSLLADVLVQRMGAEPNLHSLIDAGELPHATLLSGRRVVNEEHPAYVGIYNGAASEPAVRASIEEADVLIKAGVRFTDLTSGFFSQHLSIDGLIDVGPGASSVGGTIHGPIELADALDALHAIFVDRGPVRHVGRPRPARHPHHETHAGEALSQSTLWHAVSEALRPGDLVIAEQGTSFYGLGLQRLPDDVLFIGQPLWASIGYTLPALLGASLAAPRRRPILLIGDGSAQLTIAELGTMMRQHVNAIIVVVNNDGYTVERAIHGADAAYNDIAQWDWTALPAALGKGRSSFSARASTPGQLHEALSAARAAGDRLSLIEAVVPRMDVPPLLRELGKAAGAANLGAASRTAEEPEVAS
jgi:TPP-dependent 2-oxoacid decarboxylase